MVKHFEMSMMGEMKFFLGLQVNQFSNGIFINQSKYILDILKRFGMENCGTVPTPMVEQAKLKLDLVGKQVDHTYYRNMIVSLMYVTSSRPDIMFVTCMCARYKANPNEHHVLAVKRIFCYLKGTINLGLWYPKDPSFDLTAYSNADHAGCHLDQKKYHDEIKIDELKGNFNSMSIEINKKKKLQQLEQVANLSTYPSKRFNYFCYDDDDDEDYTIVITHGFLITDSLIMENEHLDTILETESNEFIKSSVENLVPIPSELEDFSNIETLVMTSQATRSLILFSRSFFDELAHTDLIPPGINKAFYDDHVKEISNGSTITHSGSSLYDSFIFDLLINPFPPANRSDLYEFSDELTHIISPPEYDCFFFKIELNSRDFTMDVVEDIFLIRELRVHNDLTTHLPLQLNLEFILSSESLFTYMYGSFFLSFYIQLLHNIFYPSRMKIPF
nr:hypothetical protein [Tanacetum cinerariifolium]